MAEDKGNSIAEGLLSQEGDSYHPHFYEMQKWLKDPNKDTLPKGVRPVRFERDGSMSRHPVVLRDAQDIVDADDISASKWLAYDLPHNDKTNSGSSPSKYLYPNPLTANLMDKYSDFLYTSPGANKQGDAPLYQKDNAYHMTKPVEVYGRGFIEFPGEGTWGDRVKPDTANTAQEPHTPSQDFDADMPKNLQDGVTKKEVDTEKKQAKNAIDNVQEELFETAKATSPAEKAEEEHEDANAIEDAQKQVTQAAQAELDFDAGREKEDLSQYTPDKMKDINERLRALGMDDDTFSDEDISGNYEPELATSTGSGTDTQEPANTYSWDESQFQKEPIAAPKEEEPAPKKAEPEKTYTWDDFFGQYEPKAFSAAETSSMKGAFGKGIPQDVYDQLNETYSDRKKIAPATEVPKDAADATITPDEGTAKIDAVENIDNAAAGNSITPDEGTAELGEVKHYPNSQKDVTKNKYSVAGPMLLGSVLQGLGGVADILTSGGINFNPVGQGSFGTGNTYRSPLAGKFSTAANAMANSLVAPAVAKKRAEMLENFVKDSKEREQELLASPHYKSLSPAGKRDVLVKFGATNDLLLRSMLHTFDIGAPVPKPSDKRVKQDIKPTKKLKPREVVKLTRKNVLSDEDAKIIQDSMQGVDAMELAKAILEEGPPFDAADMELLHNLANGDSYGYDVKDAGYWRDDVLNGYMEHIHNYFYKYKPEATEIDPEIDPNEQHIGPMAQDIEKVNPAAIQETDEGVKTVDTGRLALMNAGAIAELAREVAKLKGGK